MPREVTGWEPVPWGWEAAGPGRHKLGLPRATARWLRGRWGHTALLPRVVCCYWETGWPQGNQCSDPRNMLFPRISARGCFLHTLSCCHVGAGSRAEPWFLFIRSHRSLLLLGPQARVCSRKGKEPRGLGTRSHPFGAGRSWRRCNNKRSLMAVGRSNSSAITHCSATRLQSPRELCTLRSLAEQNWTRACRPPGRS